MKTPKLFVIVLNWNSANDTIRCVESFERCNYLNSTLLVVDNSSTDDSVALIKDRIPGVTLIETEKNLGYTGGNNVGIKYAMQNGAEYVLIVNNDTEVVNLDFLQKMVAAMEENPAVGIMGPKVINPGGNTQETILYSPVFMNCVTVSFHIRFGKMTRWDYSILQEVEAVSGVCWLIRKEVIEQVGLLDELFFMYVEEQDYCYRAQKAGWKILFFPIKSVLHYKQSVDINKERNFRQYVYVRRNLVLFLRKHFGLVQGGVMAGLILFSNGFKYCVSKIGRKDVGFYTYNLLKTLFKEMWYVLWHFKQYA